MNYDNFGLGSLGRAVSKGAILVQVHNHSGPSPSPFCFKSGAVLGQVRSHFGSSPLLFWAKSVAILVQVHSHSKNVLKFFFI